MFYSNLFTQILFLFNVLIFQTQCSPIGFHPGAQPKAEEVAWKEGLYRPIFPGPYTLLPGPPSLQRRTIPSEGPLVTRYTPQATSTAAPFGNFSLASTSGRIRRFQNTSSISIVGETSQPLASTTIPLTSTTLPLASTMTLPVKSTTPSASPLFTTSANSSVTPTPSAIPVTPSTTASTTNLTTPAPAPRLRPQAAASLKIAFENNLPSSNVHVYITGLDVNGKVVMLTTGGTFYYPSTSSQTPVSINANIAIPITSSLTIPGYISSARLWFADGKLDFKMVATAAGVGIVAPTSVNPSDPSHDVNWGFVELTYNLSGLFANISYVDFVGLPLGIKLASAQSRLQSALGVPADAVKKTCNKLKAQASADGQPWDQLCIYGSSGKLVRVNSPGSYVSTSTNAFSNYFTEYVDQVWQLYRSTPLTIRTQNGLGQVSCRVGSNDQLTCAGDNRSYSKPTAVDIFGCSSGPFGILGTDNSIHLAVVPRLCAAFNRATLHRKGGHTQPNLAPQYYYQTAPNNKYSQFVHEIEAKGRGYAFSYDDVAPNAKSNVAGSVYSTDPVELTVVVGGSRKRN